MPKHSDDAAEDRREDLLTIDSEIDTLNADSMTDTEATVRDMAKRLSEGWAGKWEEPTMGECLIAASNIYLAQVIKHVAVFKKS